MSGTGPVCRLNFDNSFTRELPADPDARTFPRQVTGAAFSRVRPAVVAAPRLISASREVLALLGLSPEAAGSEEFLQVFSGNRVLPSMDPFAMCYGGHQFGHWAGQLGDGRAINLGEVVAPGGQRWMLQLKGSGRTPYSRTADGLAVLRSSVREYLCSEAMFHLGVPTTRALSLITTGENVMRDMFYDGNVQYEPGAVVCRVAPTFTRFGNFELFAARGERELLENLMAYTVRTSFPHLGDPGPETYRRWFDEICRSTATMMVEWMRVGFVHGVMNTDNMSILGLTLDYGPYGWLEDFDPGWTPNTTDAGGRRYRFGNQPQIGLWNLSRLAEALAAVIEDTGALETSLRAYGEVFDEGWRRMMAAKLGLGTFDEELVDELHGILQAVETDMTLFYRGLASVDLEGVTPVTAAVAGPLAPAYYRTEPLDEAYRARLGAWLARYGALVRAEGTRPEARRERMDAVNPLYVLRNYLAQLAIDAAEGGDPRRVEEQLEVLRHPYTEQPGREEYAARRPEWARHRAGCSMLSCSS